MKRFLTVAVLPMLFFLLGCSHSGTLETRLIALEQSVKATNSKTELEIEKINRTLGEIKKEQASIKMMADENDKRISQLEALVASKRPQEKRIEGSITFVKGSTAFISVGKAAGVRLGDIFGVYTGRENKEKVASIKITAVDLESSSGEIEDKTQDVGIGYFVRIAR